MEELIETVFGLPSGCLSKGNGWSFVFAAEHSGYVKLAMIAAIAFMAYVAIRSYRREGDAPARVKATLSTVRILVILLAMGILLRPSLVVRSAQTLYRTVILLVDKSYSMSRKDDYAASPAAQPLARSLGVAPAELETLDRLQIAGRLLSTPQGPIDQLSRDHRVVVMAFSCPGAKDEKYTRKVGEIFTAGSRATSQPARRQLEEMFRSFKADGLETDHSAALWDALEEGRGHRVAAIVLVGDGQNTGEQGEERLRAAVQQAQRLRVPIHAVCVGDPHPPEAITEVMLEGPPDMRPEGDTEFIVRLTHRNLGGESAVVAVLRREKQGEPWTPACDEQKIVLEGAKAVAGEPGAPEPARIWQALTVRPKGEPKRAEDYTVEYKAVVKGRRGTKESPPARVTVSDRKINVLLISGDAGWEFQRLKDLLYRSPDRYQSSIWQQNADPETNQAASTGMKIARLPRTLEELMGSPDGKPHPGYQVIILYDPQPTAEGFDEKFVENLNTFVERHKGGLCYIAGNKYSETLLVGDARWRRLAGLLPVELARNPINYPARIKDKKPAPAPFRLTVHGVDHPVMRLADDLEESKAAWGILPGVYWSHPVVKVKPVGRPLAVNPSRQTAREGPEPLVVAMPAGGKVLYMGTDETWRWLVVGEGRYYRRFWHNVIRYLAPQTKAKRVVIYTEGEQFYQTEKIPVFADVYDKDFQPVTARESKEGTYTIEMVDTQTGRARPIELRAVDPKDRPGQYKGTLIPGEPGTFNLTAMRNDPLADKIVESRRIVIKPPDAEVLRPEANPQGLMKIAESNFLPAHEIGRLPEQIPPGRLTTTVVQTYSLWDTYVALGVIAALLTVEWILRKKYNMT